MIIVKINLHLVNNYSKIFSDIFLQLNDYKLNRIEILNIIIGRLYLQGTPNYTYRQERVKDH